ncbi:histidine kinase [Nocardia sp. NPDC127526]|uniref:sensor histidine kinase n=1 Tax=Nocardia sp. NPDC127526 TaxID=3345393 RepID=UPI0036366F23
MSRPQRIRRLILDVLLALFSGFMAFDEVQRTSIGLLPAAAGPPLAIVAGAALLFRRNRPLPVLAFTVAADILVGSTWPMLLAMYTVANRYGNRTRTWLATAATIVVAVIPWGTSTTPSLFFNRGTIILLLILVPTLIGLWTNQRAQTLDSLRERAEQAERERDLLAAAAVEAERLRIAREMHDIVAHRISQITVLAGALEVSSTGKPADMAGTIRETGAHALAEMRELLGVLRQSDAEAGRTPETSLPRVEDRGAGERARTGAQPAAAEPSKVAQQATEDISTGTGSVDRSVGGRQAGADRSGAARPERARDAGPDAVRPETSAAGADERAPLRPTPNLAAIAELVENAVAAGQLVDVSLPAQLPAVPGAVGRAAYRVVQEALTNATKHAAGAEVRVSVVARADSLEVDVRNGPGERTALAAQGSGFGLVGMRERVELAGGALHSGCTPSGGFAVHASFPLGEQA